MVAAESLDPDNSFWDWIAYDLRRYRLKHGETVQQVADVIGRSRSDVSNCEAGRRRINVESARLLDKHWDTGGHFERLIGYASRNHDPDWFREHLTLEATADELRIFELSFIPGLLQTERYARVVISGNGSKNVEAAVEERMSRQAVLHRIEPPLVWVLLDEGVIDRPLGGAEVMREQLAHLLEVGELPHIVIRVLPRSAGFHPGLTSAFKLLTVDGRDLVYTESSGGGRLVQDPGEVRSFEIQFNRVGAKALSEDASRELIRRVMEAMT